MNFGNLNNRIQTLSKQTSRNSFGEQETTWNPTKTLHCRVIVKQTTRTSDQVTINTTELVVTCRYSKATSTLSPESKIKYNNELYDVDSVVDKFQNKVQVEITCHRIM
ncbi:head-tail adaptor protein [Moritella viscosa]|uniref:Phage head-tail adaptor n=1 Tax=Moritella viscosa TaxID=80854 RepID=A0A1L0APJ9_9GAMM|nr:head-tail adaptor protein [Moritella viscosa]SGZ16463.1 Putative uncharacterized protein [Moritella viscosa]